MLLYNGINENKLMIGDNMKLFKFILSIPLIGLIFVMVGLAVAAPLFLTLLIHKFYEEYVSSGWKAISYSISIIAELFLLTAFLNDQEPIIYVAISCAMLFYCAVSALVFSAKAKK